MARLTDVSVTKGNTKVCDRCAEEKLETDFDLSNRNRKNKYRNQCKACRREMHMLRTYGIGFDEYNSMFDEQRGCCAICDTHQNEIGKPLYVDHDHETGEVRGLLCMKCNAGLGLFNDEIESVESAIKYLKKYG